MRTLADESAYNLVWSCCADVAVLCLLISLAVGGQRTQTRSLAETAVSIAAD